MPPAKPEHVEGLWARHLMNEMEPDEQLRLSRRQTTHGVGVPHLLQQRMAHKNSLSPGQGAFSALTSRTGPLMTPINLTNPIDLINCSWTGWSGWSGSPG